MAVDEQTQLEEAKRELLRAKRSHAKTRHEVSQIRRLRGQNGFGPLLGEIFRIREDRRP